MIGVSWAVGLDFFLHSEWIVVRIQELDFDMVEVWKKIVYKK